MTDWLLGKNFVVKQVYHYPPASVNIDFGQMFIMCMYCMYVLKRGTCDLPGVVGHLAIGGGGGGGAGGIGLSQVCNGGRGAGGVKN